MPHHYTMQDQDTLLAWAAPRCGMPGCTFPAASHAIGVVTEDGEILAVGVYIPLFSGEVECHFASNGTRRWATKGTLQIIFSYAFHALGAERITCMIEATDVPTLTLCLKTGWQMEARVRQAMPTGADGIIFSMMKDECFWLEMEIDDGR